jgi:hypothetical protein
MFASIIPLFLAAGVYGLPAPQGSLVGFDDSNTAHHVDPRDVAHVLRQATLLGFDDSNDAIHAFTRDRVYLGRMPADVATTHLNRRQDVGACSPLTTEQMDSIAGWNALEDIRKGLFGDGDHISHTNPQTEPDKTQNPPSQWNLPDLKAQRCIASDPIGTLELVGEPSCDKQTTTIEGQTTGVNTTSTISQSIGGTISMTHSVSNQEDVGLSMSFEVSFGIPEISQTKITTGFTFSYSHTDQKATTNDKSATTTQTLAMPNPDGKHCIATLDTETCRAKAKGSIKSFASGWVWWSHKDRVQYNEDFAKSKNMNFPDNNKHWSWAVTMEGLISEDERVIMTPLTSDIGSTQVNSMYDAKCE